MRKCKNHRKRKRGVDGGINGWTDRPTKRSGESRKKEYDKTRSQVVGCHFHRDAEQQFVSPSRLSLDVHRQSSGNDNDDDDDDDDGDDDDEVHRQSSGNDDDDDDDDNSDDDDDGHRQSTGNDNDDDDDDDDDGVCEQCRYSGGGAG